MCYFLECFGAWLDIMQRIITFCLACILCCAVFSGLGIMLAAGIAYGYNYSMAEFLVFKREDVAVYIKRLPARSKHEIYSSLRRQGEQEGPAEQGRQTGPAEQRGQAGQVGQAGQGGECGPGGQCGQGGPGGIRTYESPDALPGKEPPNQYYRRNQKSSEASDYVFQPDTYVQKLEMNKHLLDHDQAYIERYAPQRVTPFLSLTTVDEREYELERVKQMNSNPSTSDIPQLLQALQVPLARRKDYSKKAEILPTLGIGLQSKKTESTTPKPSVGQEQTVTVKSLLLDPLEQWSGRVKPLNPNSLIEWPGAVKPIDLNSLNEWTGEARPIKPKVLDRGYDTATAQDPKLLERGIDAAKAQAPNLLDRGTDAANTEHPSLFDRWSGAIKAQEPKLLERGHDAAKDQEPKLIQRGPYIERDPLNRHGMHVTANPVKPRTLLDESEIVMRNFSPDMTEEVSGTSILDVYRDYELMDDNTKPKENVEKTAFTEGKITLKQYIPMRHWGITQPPTTSTTQAIDDENIIYRPIV